MSAANSEAAAYRRVRSFSSAFIVIHSRSPRSNRAIVRTSLRRCRATSCAASPIVLSRVEGLGGSVSRITRWISANPALRSDFESNGSAPTSNSYSSTPSE